MAQDMANIILWSLCMLFATFSIEAAGDETHSLTVNGQKRSYRIHVPSASTPMPLVLMLHGAGGTAERAARHCGWIAKSDQESFIVVFPEALPANPSKPSHFGTNPNLWDDGAHRTHPTDDIAFLRSLIQDVMQHHNVDPKRIYCTGFSNGASMSFYAGIELSDLLAAIAPVSGHLWIKSPQPKRQISLMLIAGSQDPLNPLLGGKAFNPWLKRNTVKPPMIESVNIWLKLLGISESQKTIQKSSDTLITRYGPNPKGLEVIYIIIEGQGHEWPGSPRVHPEFLTGKNQTTFNATDAIWNFFKTQKSDTP